VIRSASEAGHETGLHAWDHHAWQTRIDRMGMKAIRASLTKGFEMLAHILGRPPECSAVPGWRCNAFTLIEKARFPFIYNSDCRGESLFYPLINGEVSAQPQVPVTLPTYDEVIGRNGISNADYNEFLLSLFKKDRLNVLTVHAEVEGMKTLDMFEDFLQTARSKGISFVPLGMLLRESPPKVNTSIKKSSIQGRQGWIACQSSI
jgi:undecaprenyl phosphate-alpha-L-ara4FN deformylase